jgi:hypothetical protein
VMRRIVLRNDANVPHRESTMPRATSRALKNGTARYNYR